MRLLILLLLGLQGYAEGRINCGEDLRFLVTKDGNQYKLQLCTSRNNCTDKYNFINLNQVCEACKKIPGKQMDGKTIIMLYSMFDTVGMGK